MALGCVRVDLTVRLGREVEGFSIAAACSFAPRVSTCFMPRIRQLLVPLEINFNLIFYLSDGVLRSIPYLFPGSGKVFCCFAILAALNCDCVSAYRSFRAS